MQPEHIARSETLPRQQEWGAVSAWLPSLAITRAQLFILLAFILPAAASLLAPMLSTDLAYQVRVGQLMLEGRTLVEVDPFTFTRGGHAWLNQQWGASLALGLSFELFSWSGLLVARALLIGATFGLVFAACRAVGARSIIASLVTLGAFAVASTNLALRAQTFGLLAFAALVAILAYRHRHPRLIVLVPLVILAWANLHGSFVLAWPAIALAALADWPARRRSSAALVLILLVSMAASLVNPWGVAVWDYALRLMSNPLISALVVEWQATTLPSTTGLLFLASVAVSVVLVLAKGGTLPRATLAWLGLLMLLGWLMTRGVAWWAIGVAPVVAYLARDLAISRPAYLRVALDGRRSLAYTAIAGLLVAFLLAALPNWRTSDPLTGPAGSMPDAPRGVTRALAQVAQPQDRLFVTQRWASWFELAVPDVVVMVDSRIELFDAAIWTDYLSVRHASADWQAILDRWQVTLVAVPADARLAPRLARSSTWGPLHVDDEAVLYQRKRD